MLTTKARKTRADLFALPPETRAERIEGEIFMSPAPLLRELRLPVDAVFE